MLTDNILLLILVFLALLTTCVVGFAGYFIYSKIQQWKANKIMSQAPIIEIDKLREDLTEGWGFTVNNQIVLQDNNPFIFNNKKTAEDYLASKFPKNGKLIYQRWDLEKRQLIVGEVRQRGTN